MPLSASGKSSPDGLAYDVVSALTIAAVADVAGATPAGGTGATAGAYDTAANRNTLIATVAETKAQLNDLLAKLRAAGILTA